MSKDRIRALKSSGKLADGFDLSREILDSLTAGVAVVDHNGVICEVNQAWRRFCAENGGSDEKTGLGVNYLEVCRSAQGEDWLLAARASAGIEEVLAGSRDVFRLEYPCHSPTQQRWFLLYVSRLANDSRYAVTSHLPITDRKLVEQRLVEAERLAAIGQAMQGLSHTGRNTLQRAQGQIDLLRCHLEAEPDALQMVEQIESAQRHLLSLYEEVQRYAAPIVLQRQPCRLEDLVDAVWSSFESRPVNARFTHVRADNLPECEIDRAAIGQVLRHVLDNAIATDATSPEIEVCYRGDQVDGSPAVTVIVSDHGPGVPSQDWEQVFEPFYTTKLHGTGLGLAICKRIVQAHGGRIRLDSSRGRGASVYISLPVSSAAEQ